MVTISQSLVVISCLCGILFFIYVNFFSYARLQLDKRRMIREANEEERRAVEADRQAALPALPAFNREQAEESMYYLYQEQVRRLIDAKIDILRSMSDTQNRIALMQAEVARNTSQRDLLMVQSRVAGQEVLSLPEPAAEGEYADDHRDAEVLQGGSVVVFKPRERAMNSLIEQQKLAREEAERRLAMIDEQMRSLPGASLDRWVASQSSGIHALANAAD